jgi:Tfp pilus assembly protein FimV
VLVGGRAPTRLAQQAVYRRRRLLVALAVAVLVVALTLLATAAAARIAGGAPSAAGGPSPTSAAASSAAGVAAPATLVVQPGDTLWTIAAEVAPDADVRITVDQLVALNGSSPIVPGQELVLPA